MTAGERAAVNGAICFAVDESTNLSRESVLSRARTSRSRCHFVCKASPLDLRRRSDPRLLSNDLIRRLAPRSCRSRSACLATADRRPRCATNQIGSPHAEVDPMPGRRRPTRAARAPPQGCPGGAQQRPTLAIRFVIGKSCFIMLNIVPLQAGCGVARRGFLAAALFALLRRRRTAVIA